MKRRGKNAEKEIKAFRSGGNGSRRAYFLQKVLANKQRTSNNK